MTEAATKAPKVTRTFDLHTYKVLSPDWLTEHQPRTLEHMVTHPDETYEMSMMSEIGDGVFVAWSTCDRCGKHYTLCTDLEGPKEPDSIAGWRSKRLAGSFDTRPDLGADRTVLAKVIKELRDRGYAVHDVPDPVIETVEVKVPDHTLFLQLFKAAAECEAPEGTQLDDVLATFQEAYDQFAGHVTPSVTPLEDLAIPDLTEKEADDFMSALTADDLVNEDAIDFARETLGEDATDDDVRNLAEQRAERDLKEYDVDF